MAKKICYLCGTQVPKDSKSKDHVPPEQIFAKSIRKQFNPQLLTLPTHLTCNQSFKHDEDYFVNTLLPHAIDSPAGWEFGQGLRAKIKNGKEIPLFKKILSEFEDRPSGLILPKGLVVKRHDHIRIERIVWKIFRGLYFHHEGKFLPEETPHKFLEMLVGKPKESTYLPWLNTQPSNGKYPGVFDYRRLQLPSKKWPNLWAFLLWDSIVMIMAFQAPQPQSYSPSQIVTKLATM
jgi:hypothetical protein